MANRRFTSQFNYSWEQYPVTLSGTYKVTAIGSAAVLVTQGITVTAGLFGVGGNSITIAFTAGATAGAEVVTVSGNAISVQIETGVSTVTQVRTAINASAAAAALVSASGTSGSAVVTASALPLATGASTTFTVVGGTGMTLTQAATGFYWMTLADSYPNLIGANIMFQSSASNLDLHAVIHSQTVSAAVDPNVNPNSGTNTNPKIKFKTISTTTRTDVAVNDTILVTFRLRNSNQSP